MHKTNTVDYAVLYEGEIWLELDDAKTVHLKRGDVVVQWPGVRAVELG